jgi:DNA-binding transcriptional ArsR family regulator
MRTEARASSLLSGLLHQVRMQIMAELAGREGLTAAELQSLLRDVPAATLYRQLSALESAELVRVSATRGAGRGPAERIFALPDPRGAHALGEALKSPAAVLRLFLAFTAMMVGQFSRYARRARRERAAAPFFRGWPVYATDEEFARLTESLKALCDDAFSRSTASAASPKRRRRFVYVVTVPEAEGA